MSFKCGKTRKQLLSKGKDFKLSILTSEFRVYWRCSILNHVVHNGV